MTPEEEKLTPTLIEARKAEAGRWLAQQYSAPSTDSDAGIFLKKLRADEARRKMLADVDSDQVSDVK